MEIIEGGVTAAKGFKAAGMAAGIKYKNGKKDMAMVFSEKPCVTAGTFTLNRVFAAPVKWDKSIVYSEEGAHAIVVNSGVANACTGTDGDEACALEAKTAGEVLGVPAKSVLLGSTGVIGMQLPMDRMCAGIKALPELLDSTKEAGTLAAEAIMTTDARNKQVACTVEIGGKTVTVGGMCKGAGMIHPHMATMLCFITSDAVIDKKALQKMTSDIVEDSFNMISVDGDTSTNDTVLVLANGEADNEKITEGCKDYDTFYEALSYVLTELSKMIAGDGEGCTCLFEVQVKGAKDKEQAKILAKSIVTSNLTKAAIFGHDANWGRILCAIGYAEAEFDISKVSVSLRSGVGSVKVCENGAGVEFSEDEAAKLLAKDEIFIDINLGQGEASAKAWGCDLTYDYIKINADYRS